MATFSGDENHEVEKFCIICRETTVDPCHNGAKAIKGVDLSMIVGVGLATRNLKHDGFCLPLDSQWVCSKCAQARGTGNGGIRQAMITFKASDVVKHVVLVPVRQDRDFPVTGDVPQARKQTCATVVNLASSIAKYGSNSHAVASGLAALAEKENDTPYRLLPTGTHCTDFNNMLWH